LGAYENILALVACTLLAEPADSKRMVRGQMGFEAWGEPAGPNLQTAISKAYLPHA
jgi:hypothetical protein